MMDAGVLLSLPTESIAIRIVVASLAAVLLARVLLRTGLRVPRVRAATAFVPAAALMAVLLLFGGSLRLPSLMMPVDGGGSLPIPVHNSYLHFAPVAVPLLLGLWAAVAGVRIWLRMRAARRTYRDAAAAFDVDSTGPPRVRQTVRDVAERLRIVAPPVAVVDGCVGGASVVGIRQPVLMLDRGLVDRLDDEELEGVIAHELAHVRRHDNLVALGLGLVRDIGFFVPGARWGVRQLHAERELAADQLAVAVTRRPAALASGLLAVIDLADGDEPGVACASLAPSGDIVGRVQTLIDERPPAGAVRGGVELAAVSVAVTIAVVAGAQVPGLVADSGQRDALAVLLRTSSPPVAETSIAELPEARAFQVYRRSSRLAPAAVTPARDAAVLDDDPSEVSRASLLACAANPAGCEDPEPSPRLGLQPRPVVRDNAALVDRWRARPVVATDEGPALYILQRLQRLE